MLSYPHFLIKGQKGDKGLVGQKGERCCAGTSFGKSWVHNYGIKVCKIMINFINMMIKL